MKLILGSGSPRRRELLAQIGVVADDVRAPDIDETPLAGELPRPYCARMAREKVAAVPAEDDDIVLCADTSVAGGYGIQGPAGAFIPWISGSFTAIVGLPLAETANLLMAAGYPLYGAHT